MNENQLDIFSGHTQAMNEAYDCVKKCDFSGASERFREALDMDADNKEAQEGLEAAGYWQLVFRQLQVAEGKDRESLLYRRISDYTFTGAYGHQLLRKALTGKLIEGMEHQNRFFLPEGLCIVDLYLELNQHAEAENALQIRLQRIPVTLIRAAAWQIYSGRRENAARPNKIMYSCSIALAAKSFLKKSNITNSERLLTAKA